MDDQPETLARVVDALDRIERRLATAERKNAELEAKFNRQQDILLELMNDLRRRGR